ncbi:MAG TPA: NAD(P)(+) transhydrogenase (Re/Si-specific) subunit alpha, partial [Blastocatellia bacterium]|nr:NAD(P)(+) transhydrogenase (Re/Si-specific) subunit alpha [Blastocatellia bacterium]
MRIVVLNEIAGDETRVALVPESLKKLSSFKATVAVEAGAGIEAGALDEDYKKAGAELFVDRKQALASADVVASINLPDDEVIRGMKSGAVVIGFMRPLDYPEKLVPLIEHGLTGFSVELIPRTTRAQSMDALSTMATIVGYKAVLLAADRLPKMFPMLTTAAGTVPPAKALVIGAGVAGLQAIATARRVGAVVDGFDIRAA